MIKIVHITTVHYRRDTRIFRKECISLASQFGLVKLVVGDGLGDEKESGVEFVDIGARPKSRLKRILMQPWRVYFILRRLKPTIVHLHDPELLLIGFLLARYGVTVIYDAHEDVPRQILSKHWISPVLRSSISWLIEGIENFIVRRLNAVATSTPHIAQRFKRINPNTVDIKNYPLTDELAPLPVRAIRRRQICYVGGISRNRGIRPLIEALLLVPNIRLALCGQFSEADFQAELLQLPGWRQVDYLGLVDRDGVRKVMAESIAGIVTLFPTPNHIESLPIKMFEYMSAELPVIASDFPLWRQILTDANAGLCVQPKSPTAIADAIRQLDENPTLVQAMGMAGREAVLTQYNWSNEAEKLIDFYMRTR